MLDHFAGCLARTGRRRLNMLVERVLNTAAPEDLSATARAVRILGRILSILEIYEYQPPTRLGWEHAQGIVMAIFSPDGAAQVPVKQRIAAAEALGRAGDPRFTSLNPEMLPVPEMPHVLLGKYPVTVAEYLRFVENGGYEEAGLWQVEGWRMKEEGGWKEPDGWEEQKEHSNRPVTRVSWYEASAFCRWLAGRTGLGFRLPKSAEWEAAAINPKGEYPWGADDPDPERLNYDQNVGSPTPVGIYPSGAAPGGQLDMSGNVWEWMEDAKERGSGRVVRGGGYWNDAGYCRSAFRRVRFPGDRRDYVGFRFAAGQPASSGAAGLRAEGADAPGPRDEASAGRPERGAGKRGRKTKRTA